MNYIKCPICHNYHWDYQKCSPLFKYKFPNFDGDWNEIRAHDFEEAAKKAAEYLDRDEGYLSSQLNYGRETFEEVIISDGNEEKKFIVSAEIDIIYHVIKVE
jgi:hypothetical protein